MRVSSAVRRAASSPATGWRGGRALARAGARRVAFTLVEMMCVISITGVLLAMSREPARRLVTHARVNRAAYVVASDLETALTLAGRTRRPVRITYDASLKQLTVTDRAGTTTYLRRPLGASSEFKLATLEFSATSIDVFPTGLASGPLRVRVGIDDFAREVTMTRASLIRVVPLS